MRIKFVGGVSPNIEKIQVGKYSYVCINVYQFNNCSRLIVGNCCSIADDVLLILGGGNIIQIQY